MWQLEIVNSTILNGFDADWPAIETRITEMTQKIGQTHLIRRTDAATDGSYLFDAIECFFSNHFESHDRPVVIFFNLSIFIFDHSRTSQQIDDSYRHEVSKPHILRIRKMVFPCENPHSLPTMRIMQFLR